MKLLTDDWVAKAEGDYTSSRRELQARKSPNFDAACFHAQQCVEKYLKAALHEWGTQPPRTHNLVHLLELCIPTQPLWESMRASLNVLNAYGVAFRYPGQTAERSDAKDALAVTKAMRETVRRALGLPML